MTDERLREIAKKHARDAFAPTNRLGGSHLDMIDVQNLIRAEEIIFYALKEAVTSAPEERTQEAMTLLREAHMFANAQAFVADDYDAHCDRLAKFLGYTVDTHGPIKEKE